jgi:hypothetical protein
MGIDQLGGALYKSNRTGKLLDVQYVAYAMHLHKKIEE